MKKTYLTPAIEVTDFIAEDILTTSQDLLNGLFGGDGSNGTSDTASSYTGDSRLAVSGN